MDRYFNILPKTIAIVALVLFPVILLAQTEEDLQTTDEIIEQEEPEVIIDIDGHCANLENNPPNCPEGCECVNLFFQDQIPIIKDSNRYVFLVCYWEQTVISCHENDGNIIDPPQEEPKLEDIPLGPII